MKDIKIMPLYVHYDDGFILICLKDGTYIIYNKDLDSITIENARLIYSSYRLKENKVMFGFEDGNAMILTINQNGADQSVEMDDINWRKNNGNFFENSRIICLGQANNHYYAFSRDGVIQQFNLMNPQNNQQFQWDFLVYKVHLSQTAIFVCQETKFCAIPINYNLENFNQKNFNYLCSQQIFVDGTSIEKIEQHPKFLETLKMHNGIGFIESTHDQLFILLKDSNLIIYTYGPYKDGIKVNLIKRLKFEFINPTGFSLANANSSYGCIQTQENVFRL
ncbi:hypothetical protein pb186bvf_007120 [Paramecium bursaria]